MSSLEEQVFFGSKQDMLDSYLNNRYRYLQADNSSAFDHKNNHNNNHNKIYSKVLDDISYNQPYSASDQQPSGYSGIPKYYEQNQRQIADKYQQKADLAIKKGTLQKAKRKQQQFLSDVSSNNLSSFDIAKMKFYHHPHHKALHDRKYEASSQDYEAGDRSSEARITNSIIPNLQEKQPQLISGTYYLTLQNISLDSKTISPGSCMEVCVEVGNLGSLKQIFFHNDTPQRTSFNLQGDFKLNIQNTSFEEFFVDRQAKCIKIEVLSKSTSYDRKIGTCFVPIESVVLLLQNSLIKPSSGVGSSSLTSNNKNWMVSKQITMKLMNLQTKNTADRSKATDTYIKFNLVIAKDCPHRSLLKPADYDLKQQPENEPRQIAQGTRLEMGQSHKVMVVVHSLQIKTGETLNNKYNLNYKDHSVELGSPADRQSTRFVVSINKSNQSLKEGVTFTLKSGDVSFGIIKVSVLQLFLEQSMTGRYPIENIESLQCIGFIELELSLHMIGAANGNFQKPKRQQNLIVCPAPAEAKAINQTSCKNLSQRVLQRGKSTQKQRHLVVNINQIQCLVEKQADCSVVLHRNMYLLCHLNNRDFRQSFVQPIFHKTHVQNLLMTGEQIQFSFFTEPDNSIQEKTVNIQIELFEKGADFDRIVAYSQFRCTLNPEQPIELIHLSLDCKYGSIKKQNHNFGGTSNITGEKDPVFRMYVTLGKIEYEPEYFNEEKIQPVLKIFSNRVRFTLQQEMKSARWDLRNPEHLAILKQRMRNLGGLTFIETQRLFELVKSNEKQLKESGNINIDDFLEKLLSVYPPKISIPQQTDPELFRREIDYVDGQRTGYVYEQDLWTIMQYFKIHDQFELVKELFCKKVDDNNTRLVTDIVHESSKKWTHAHATLRETSRQKGALINYLPILYALNNHNVIESQRINPHADPLAETVRPEPSENTTLISKEVRNNNQHGEIIVTIVKGTNFHHLMVTLSDKPKPPNANITCAALGLTTPTMYRDCNPVFNYSSRCGLPDSNRIHFCVNHRDIRSQGINTRIGEFFLSREQILQSAARNETIEIRLRGESMLTLTFGYPYSR